jgi:hypothetical protein
MQIPGASGTGNSSVGTGNPFPPFGFMETVRQPSENAFRSMARDCRRVNPQATGVTLANGEICIAAT